MNMEKHASEAYTLAMSKVATDEKKHRSYAKHIGAGALIGAGVGAGFLGASGALMGSLAHPNLSKEFGAIAGAAGALVGAGNGAVLGGMSTNNHLKPGFGLALGFIPSPRLRLEHKDTGAKRDIYFM